MKSFLKTFFLSIAASLTLLACTGGEAPPEVLILGDWSQVEAVPVTEQGITLEISGTNASYFSNGTSRNSSKMKLISVPSALSTYQIQSEGIWRISDGIIVESISSIEIKGTEGNPQSEAIAQQMKNSILNAPESSTEILALTDRLLTLKDPNTGMILRFEKK